MKRYSIILLMFALAFIPAKASMSAVITVDAGGLGNYSTIQTAVDAALAGDEIHVAAGTYYENVILDNTTTPNNIKLYGGYESSGWTRDITANVTVIDGGGLDSTVSIAGVSGVTIDGFTVTGGAPSGIVAGIYIYGCSPNVTNNIVDTNGRHGIYVEGSASPRIQRNLIVSNGYYAVYCFSFGGAGTPLIYNNTIDGNKTGISLYSFSPKILNNILSSNTDYGINVQVFSSPISNYNCFWNNGISDYNDWSMAFRDIHADPSYIGGGDYGLQESPSVSMCVDAGLDIGLAYNGHLPDLGAYESNASRSTPWPPSGLTVSPLSAKAYMSWTPNAEAAVAGYKISYGTTSGSYTGTVDVGNVTSGTIDSLTNGVEYFFAIKAYFDPVNISDYSVEKSATPTNGNPELPHYTWDESFSADCTRCHYTQSGSSLLPAGYDYRYSGELCLSCHNLTGSARGMLVDQANSHPVYVNVTSGGNSAPTYGNVTGRYSNSMWSVLKDGDVIVCQTCHNIMEKPESPGRVWEFTEFAQIDSYKTYNLQNGGWSFYAFAEPRVYGSASLLSAPLMVKDRRDYLLPDNVLQDYSPNNGSIKFYAPYFEYAYVSLYFPYLRVSNSDNNMCLDCHTSYQTHQGQNCMTCHELHNYTNRLGVKPRVKTPNSGIKSVVFTSNTSADSFADGDNVYDGICEVCHTQTMYHTNNGTGFDAHTSTGIDYSGWNCLGCHTHQNGFTP